jgi:SAM-dependent methyltransferase
MNAYQSLESAQAYQNFLSSENGQIFKKVVLGAVLKRLDLSAKLSILDAGCGAGWLAFGLFKQGYRVAGCDASENLINQAQELYPEIPFQTADLTQSLPFPQESFDAIILNMVAHDLEDQPAAFKNLGLVLKERGKLIATIVNPYYGYPIGVWKRGLKGFLLRQKPKLKLAQAYNLLKFKPDKSFVWNPYLKSRFYPLSEHLNNLLNAGFRLTRFEDLDCAQDRKEFNLEYQLHRFPIILLLEFARH